MSDIDISALHLHDQFGSDHITARDLDFYSLLRRRGDDGSLYFNKQRALLFESDAIGKLRQQLITHAGLQETMGILFRFGYAQGDKDAGILAKDVNWASDADWLAAGTVLPMLSGMARIETQALEYDRETGQFYMKGAWHNSYEAKEHLKHFGSSDEPVCFALAGYASAYSSRFFGRDLLAVETECVARGDPYCVWEIKPVEEWGDEARTYLNALRNGGQADQFSQTQANFIIENSPVVVFRWRAVEGYPVEYVSANIEQFGYTSEEFVSGETSYPSIVHPDDLDRALSEIQHNADQSFDSFTVEYRLITKNGETRWVDTKLTFERDNAGQISHFLGVLSDITDRKRSVDLLKEKETDHKESET